MFDNTVHITKMNCMHYNSMVGCSGIKAKDFESEQFHCKQCEGFKKKLYVGDLLFALLHGTGWVI